MIASGAMDRIAPVPGWTLPGVFTLGGAQVALKDQGCLIEVASLSSAPRPCWRWRLGNIATWGPRSR